MLGPAERGENPEAVRRWRAAVLEAADDVIALWQLRHGTDRHGRRSHEPRAR